MNDPGTKSGYSMPEIGHCSVEAKKRNVQWPAAFPSWDITILFNWPRLYVRHDQGPTVPLSNYYNFHLKGQTVLHRVNYAKHGYFSLSLSYNDNMSLDSVYFLCLWRGLSKQWENFTSSSSAIEVKRFQVNRWVNASRHPSPNSEVYNSPDQAAQYHIISWWFHLSDPALGWLT